MMILPFKKKKPHKSREGKIGLTLAANDIDVVIDVGANIGQTHDLLREHGFSGPIISVEPLPALQDVLQPKAAQDPLWEVLPPLALGDHNGTCEINVSESSDLSSVLASTPELMTALPKTCVQTRETVEMKTLDTLYAELESIHLLSEKNVFIKIDAQGAEKMILEKAPRTLQKIAGIQIEMSLFALYQDEALYHEILPILHDAGFEAHMLVETNFSRKLNRQLQIDGIFYKEKR